MEKDNKDLGDLLGHRQRMETMKIPKFSITAKRYGCIGDHASSLYNVLRKSLTWPCGCLIPHNASLRLEARTSREPNPTHEKYSDLCFNVLFFFDTNSSISQTLPPWNWRETRIEPINDTNSQDKSIHNVPDFTGPAQIQAAASFVTAKNTTISTLARTTVPSFSFIDSFSVQSVISCTTALQLLLLTISKFTDLKARLEEWYPAYFQQRPQHNLVYHRKPF